jgi:PPOX class probable F420-dependent enzyme
MGTHQRGQIEMTEDEITTFIEQSRTATMATIGKTGMPHLVAMWYAIVDGDICFETKTKSQKAVNLRRDPRIVVSIEDGWTYETLRGVSI